MPQSSPVFELSWEWGHALLSPTAAMLWSCAFRLPSGRVFKPFARAPWAIGPRAEPESGLADLPGHMRRLGGEFVCLPFGTDETAPGRPMHGPAADADWDVLRATETEVVFRLDYPGDDDVAFLLRRIAVVPDAPALDLDLTVHVRRDSERTLALHPVLRLPEPPGRLHIGAAFDFGLTWPDPLPGTSILQPRARFASLDAVPRANGSFADYADPAFSIPQEELLQLFGVRGPVTVSYPEESARCVIAWDLPLLPSCLIWISDRKLTAPPWSGRFRGIGIEPAAAAFDLPTLAARVDPFVRQAGHATTVTLQAQMPTTIRYRITGEDIKVGS